MRARGFPAGGVVTTPDTDRCKGILAILGPIPSNEREYVHAAIEELEAARELIDGINETLRDADLAIVGLRVRVSNYLGATS
jgi:hypothetical protein